MSRYIDFDKPLSDDDKEYLRKRPYGKDAIALNETRFGELSDEEKDQVVKQKDADDQAQAEAEAELEELQKDAELPFDDDVIAKVEGLDYNELRKACSKHDLDATGKAEELEDRLLEFYQEEKNKKEPTTVV